MPEPIKVHLVSHGPAWTPAAKAEGIRIMRSLGPVVAAVHHVGSTSIPEICAKAILDLLLEVRSLDELDEARAHVEALGYAWWGEYGIKNRRYCTRTNPVTGQRLVQLHSFAVGDPEVERMLAFRDYLRAHPEQARAYEKEKQRCRDLHPNDSYAYTDAKSDWITAIIPDAIDYYRMHLRNINIHQK